jgi:hypothetical protein
MLSHERDLAKALCAYLVQYLTLNPDMKCLPAIISIDMHRLHSWLLQNQQACPDLFCDKTQLDAALGYNNFCCEVVTSTKSSL